MSGLSIWKYALRIEDWQVLEMPFGWTRVALQEQGGFPTLWALVDPEAVRVSTPILCFGTGHGIPVVPGEPLGTVQIEEMVWHYFLEGARAGVPARDLGADYGKPGGDYTVEQEWLIGEDGTRTLVREEIRTVETLLMGPPPPLEETILDKGAGPRPSVEPKTPARLLDVGDRLAEIVRSVCGPSGPSPSRHDEDEAREWQKRRDATPPVLPPRMRNKRRKARIALLEGVLKGVVDELNSRIHPAQGQDSLVKRIQEVLG